MRRMILIVTVVIVAATTVAWVRPQAPAAGRPNVVLIMSDDLGYADLSSYGATDIRTPNIDSLGRDGIKLTDFYANGVLCSPTRAALINGRYQQRYRIDSVIGGATPPLKITGASLPQLLKNNGYATGLIGKWHLGSTVETGPRAHGFEYFFGFLGSHIDFYHHNRGAAAPDLWENDASIYPQLDGEYMTDLITDRSIRFIEQSAAANRPFFVDVAYNAPHWPYQPPGKPSPAPGTGAHQLPQQENTATRADYAAMVEAVDQGVGKILQTLERLRLTNNTIVIFTNDNGGEWLSNVGPLSNRKWTTWEGGIRVPALIKWPGRIAPGRVSDQVGITMDLSASIVAVSGGTVPADYDGINLFPILEGRAPQVERTLYWRTDVNRSMRSVRSGDWKIVVDANHLFVFNLRQDMGERNDLTSRRTDIANRLRPMITRWEQEMDAEARIHYPDAAPAGGVRGGRGAPAGAGRGGAPARGGQN
ncbi:MAG TPA: sulfatase-like hydrolase/transferase [Terriglobia bacterium]|nr:sulfatase-like hydrolase/transferase [Terriglobia bacterium]